MGRHAARLGMGAAGLALMIAVVARAQDAPGADTSVEVSQEGREVYEQICQSCHMADAQGGGGAGAAIPPLANNPRLASKDYALIPVVKGRGGMPWFTDILTEEQIAAVSTYVRSHFNAYPDPVTVEDVRRIAAGSAPEGECDCAQ